MSWQNIIGNIAPSIASALGGPLAGSAVKMLSNTLLGKEDGTKDEIEAAVSNATPEQLAQIKEMDLTFKKDMAKLGIDLERIAAEDRNSARQREMQIKDKTPAILGGFVVSGFFIILGALLFKEIPGGQKEVFHIMLGSLGAMSVGVINYYFGSSTGSQQKNALLKGQK